MRTFTDQPIVLGLDGSDSSAAAARYAAQEAATRRAPLHLLHATGTPAVPVDLYGSMAVELALRNVAAKLLDRMTRSIRQAYPDPATHHDNRAVSVRGDLMCDGAGLAAPVVAAVDDSESTGDVLGYAFETASRHHAPLVAVRAWSPGKPPGQPAPVQSAAEQERSEACALADALAGWCEEYSDVRVTQRLVRGQAHHEVVSATVGARLVVVGGGHVMRFGVLGRVPVHVLHRAGCPVAIVGGSGGGAGVDGHWTADMVKDLPA